MKDTPLEGLDPSAVRQMLLDAAQIAAAHTLSRFRTGIAVDNKLAAGFDPVTAADREAELAIRKAIGDRFPEHGIIGEEWDTKSARGRFVWIVDPIDGTRAIITGVPVWGTLVGLMVGGRAVAGLMAQPFTGEIYMSLPGEAHYHRGAERIALRTSATTELARAKLTTTSPDLFERGGLVAPWDALRRSVMLTRYGLDCYGYCLLAAGHLDLVVETGLKDVDIAPLIPLIENAGGIVTTWEDGPAHKGGRVVAAGDKRVHAQALALLNNG